MPDRIRVSKDAAPRSWNIRSSVLAGFKPALLVELIGFEPTTS